MPICEQLTAGSTILLIFKGDLPMVLTIPPGSLGLPGIGETIAFLSQKDFAIRRHERYGSVFKTNILGATTVLIQGADGNRFILENENNYFEITWPPSVRKLLGESSLPTQTGHQHINRRKILAQAFQPRALSSYTDAMITISDRYFDKWANQEELTWYPELRNYTLDIACKLLVGLEGGSKASLGHQYETWVAGLFSFPVNLPWTSFGKALRSREKLLTEIEKLILARQQQSTPPQNQDALDLLLSARDDEGQTLPVEELKDQILTLLFAGHETLTSSLVSLCMLLAQHPEVLKRARQEQQELSDQPLVSETLKEMPYLDQILKEVLRVIPPVAGGFRKVLQDCEYGGFEIKKGWQLLYQIASTHQDSSVYPDPQEFDPERFDKSRAEDKQKPFTHIPFGGGVRECIGKEFARLEMKIFAARLLREYQWELVPGQDLELAVIPTPKPNDDLKVKFRKLASCDG
jgi:retinoid hydroxylase